MMRIRSTFFGLLALALAMAVSCGSPVPIPPTAIVEVASPATATPLPTPTRTAEPPPTPAKPKAIYFNIPYVPDGDRQQSLSIYLPKDAAEHPEKTYPVLFLAHAYTLGKDTGPMWEVIQYANEQGIAAVAIDYRDTLQTGGAWPAHHDAACALAWMYTNAGDYGLDLDQMVGLGNSYGVNLVADLAMADDPAFFLSECPNGLPESRPFSGVVAFGAGTFGLSGPDMSFSTAKAAGLFEEMGLFEGSMEEMLATAQSIGVVPPLEWATYGEFGQQETGMAQVWPVYWADPGDPPFLIMTGDHDLDFWTLRDRVAFAELLQGLGVEATHVLLPDTGHTTFSKDSSTWQAPLDQFLDQVWENR